MLVGIRPDDAAYLDHSGATFVEQDESGNGSVAMYQIGNSDDAIEFNLTEYTRSFDHPVAVFRTVFGETDFDIRPPGDSPIVSELSGFDSDNWMVDLRNEKKNLEITNFDTTNGVDGTQAAWYPYIGIFNLES